MEIQPRYIVMQLTISPSLPQMYDNAVDTIAYSDYYAYSIVDDIQVIRHLFERFIFQLKMRNIFLFYIDSYEQVESRY